MQNVKKEKKMNEKKNPFNRNNKIKQKKLKNKENKKKKIAAENMLNNAFKRWYIVKKVNIY